MTTDQAEAYHSEQIEVYSTTEADLVNGFTLCNPEEVSGIVRAAQRFDMPVAIAFTVETDRRLPAGVPVEEAIDQVDSETDGGPLYYLINCSHPSHFFYSGGVNFPVDLRSNFL